LAGKAGPVALQRVAQQPLVGLLAGTEDPLEVHFQLDRVADQALPGLLRLHAHRDPVVRAEAEAQEVRAGLAAIWGEQQAGQACSSTTASGGDSADEQPGGFAWP
jgi:hypothetical protein